MLDLEQIPFVKARWYTPGRISAVELIVIHDMEAPETLSTAENTAAFFQRLPADRKASAHYCVDADSIVCCVQPMDTAFHAPKANANGIGIEHAGYAKQTTADWLDDYGKAMLDRSAELTAALCVKYDLPAVYLDSGALLPGAKGITTHWATTIAYGIAGGHTDPGGNFPMEWYIERVQHYLGAPLPQPQTQEDEDMATAIIITTEGKPWYGISLNVDPTTGRCPHWYLGESDKARLQDECDFGVYVKDANGHPVVKSLSPEQFARQIP